MSDPVGKPVEQVYSLYPWAESIQPGNGLIWLQECIRAAFAKGVYLGNEKNLRHIAVKLGWDITDMPKPLTDLSWQEEFEANRQSLLEELELWGAPTFRLRYQVAGKKKELTCWGQDRTWLLDKALVDGSSASADLTSALGVASSVSASAGSLATSTSRRIAFLWCLAGRRVISRNISCFGRHLGLHFHCF